MIPLSLILLTVAVFWRVGQHEFILYDDPDYVTRNVHVQGGLTADGLAWAFGQVRGEFTYWQGPSPQPRGHQRPPWSRQLVLAQRRFTEAIQCYRQLLALQPDTVPALNRLAWLLATHSDDSVRHGADALRFATRACELTANNDPLSLNSLAAAYAETSQFDQAVATAQRALDLANVSGQAPLAGILQKLVDLYKAKTPYRE